MTTFDEAAEIVQEHLGRTQKFPTETKQFCSLVNGLINAEKASGASAARIAEKCKELSKYCPTDAELLTTARDLARVDAVAAGTFDSTAGAANAISEVTTANWEKQYGAPKPFPIHSFKSVNTVRERERALLSAIKAKHPGELSWAKMADAAEELGYPDYAETWHNAMVGHGTWRPKAKRAAGDL